LAGIEGVTAIVRRVELDDAFYISHHDAAPPGLLGSVGVDFARVNSGDHNRLCSRDAGQTVACFYGSSPNRLLVLNEIGSFAPKKCL